MTSKGSFNTYISTEPLYLLVSAEIALSSTSALLPLHIKQINGDFLWRMKKKKTKKPRFLAKCLLLSQSKSPWPVQLARRSCKAQALGLPLPQRLRGDRTQAPNRWAPQPPGVVPRWMLRRSPRPGTRRGGHSDLLPYTGWAPVTLIPALPSVTAGTGTRTLDIHELRAEASRSAGTSAAPLRAAPHRRSQVPGSGSAPPPDFAALPPAQPPAVLPPPPAPKPSPASR